MFSMIAEALVDLADMLRDSSFDRANALVQRRGKTFGLLAQTLVRFAAMAHQRFFESADRAADALGMLIQALVDLAAVAKQRSFERTHRPGQPLRMHGNTAVGIVDGARNGVFQGNKAVAQDAGEMFGMMFEPLVGFAAVMQHRLLKCTEPLGHGLMHAIGMRADRNDRLARRRCEALLQRVCMLVHRADGALRGGGESLFERVHVRGKRARRLLRGRRELVLQRRGVGGER